ncbi:hypothetical protein PR003_g18282 [Phytophthora rubi]|uniref:Uncharacterized protein n=1 Tax=Phytophthora rubi TaxID=129364 RepID=A0A6A3KNJ0_9STRA|nr:hypothetical protein PR002_g16992 [Phytophthora rubi]KAE9008682.1 hypothetical protein PR001_g16629 [Phytophthora rubi]KAE9318256.1 hypothetical protein PR003_g18282 [Phytophthora rubi]
MVANGTDEGVFLVDDAIFTSSEANLMTPEEQLSAIQPRPIGEILYIASVVAQRQFPVDVLNNILEFAGVLLTFQAETSDLRRGRGDMNEDYLQLQLPTAEELDIPPGVDVSKCTLVVADCASKDQGWATDGREHNGTYRESSSWCEVAVKSVTAEGELRETARVPFYPNLRAGRNFRHHRKYFGSSSGLLDQVKLGDCVSIVLRSQYPGWTNSAKYGRLAVCFAVELKEDFSFVDVPFPTSAVTDEEESSGPSIPCSLQ